MDKASCHTDGTSSELKRRQDKRASNARNSWQALWSFTPPAVFLSFVYHTSHSENLIQSGFLQSRVASWKCPESCWGFVVLNSQEAVSPCQLPLSHFLSLPAGDTLGKSILFFRWHTGCYKSKPKCLQPAGVKRNHWIGVVMPHKKVLGRPLSGLGLVRGGKAPICLTEWQACLLCYLVDVSHNLFLCFLSEPLENVRKYKPEGKEVCALIWPPTACIQFWIKGILLMSKSKRENQCFLSSLRWRWQFISDSRN